MDAPAPFNQLDQALHPVAKLGYQLFQQSKTLFAIGHKSISSRLSRLVVPKRDQAVQPVPSETLNQLRQRRDQLLETDWQEAQQGVYPTSLLFDNPWDEFLIYYPMLWLDLVSIWERLQQGRYQEFSPELDTEGYPSYYLQNFHYQTDGYLSNQSAKLYDLQVELLFNGAADAMRRRILAPLKAGLSKITSVNSQQTNVLDVACGTGRTLRQIRGMLPKVSLHGTDLSPSYLRKANQLLSDIPGELPQLIQANAETLPYCDKYFHGASCVFTFHELPAGVRQNVINEVFRVLKPGGVFVICDSIQVSDSPELMPIMENFPVTFHEPYYNNYIHDDLEKRLREAGFICSDIQTHFVSKYWIAQKP